MLDQVKDRNRNYNREEGQYYHPCRNWYGETRAPHDHGNVGQIDAIAVLGDEMRGHFKRREANLLKPRNRETKAEAEEPPEVHIVFMGSHKKERPCGHESERPNPSEE